MFVTVGGDERSQMQTQDWAGGVRKLNLIYSEL